MTPSLDEALEWVGRQLDDVYNSWAGRVDGVLVDARDLAPVWLLVRLGRLGHEHVLVPIAGVVASERHVWVQYERRVLKSAPRVGRGPLRLRDELALAAHYRHAERAAELGGLPPATITCLRAPAQPARVVASSAG